MPAPAAQKVRASRADSADDIDLRTYWRILARRRWTVLGVFAATVLAAVVVTVRQTPIYAASTSIIIDLSAPKVLNNKDVQEVVETGNTGYWSSKEYYETQYKVITSRAVAQRVIESLQLARDLRFLGLDEVKDEARLKKKLEKIDPVKVLQDRLAVLPVKDSRVVRIEVEDRDRMWAATLTNAVADAYVAESLSVRATTTRSASEWLEQQLADLETKLAKSADALFKFKQAHDIVATSWEDRQGMVSQRLVAVNDALTKARVQRAALEARSEQIESLGDAIAKGTPEAEAFTVVGQSRTVQELKIRYFDAMLECANLRTQYLKDHPKIEACDTRIATARSGLVGEVRTILEGARREYREAVETERKLQRLLNETKTEAFGLNQHEKEYLELKRTHDNNQRLYELVLQRLKETSVTGMLQMSNVRVLDRAEPPEKPVSPKPLRNIALAILLGLGAGVGLVFLLEMLDATITSREQIEERLGVPFLGIIPKIQPDAGTPAELMVIAAPTSSAAECLRSIRTNLLFMSPDKPLKTILVTSSGPGEGKTTTTVALAATMANGGNRVLLVDADMRRPRVRGIFGVKGNAGLSTLIVGETTLSQAVVKTSIENLDVLPSGSIPPNPAELLHTPAFAKLLAEMAGRYDRVIFDSPPAGVVADAVVMSTQVDGTVMVLRAGRTYRDAAERTLRSLTDVNARVFGALLNELDLEDQRYEQYYYQYRSGYQPQDRPAKSTA
jgi:capsular exopolysaccharide synthesis family protein